MLEHSKAMQEQCMHVERYLAGRAVGHAGFAIAAQVEVGGTRTLVPPTRRQEAEVTAAGVVGLTGVVGNWESERDGAESDPGGGPWLGPQPQVPAHSTPPPPHPPPPCPAPPDPIGTVRSAPPLLHCSSEPPPGSPSGCRYGW